jgi:phosphosulfolactate phosphohydrolase-like enzyme
VGAAAQVTVVVLASVVRAVVVVVMALVSISVTVMVVHTVEVDWRYSEQKTLALAERVGFRRARRTLSALHPPLSQHSGCFVGSIC